MKIEMIIVCKDYSDFLAETLPQNIDQVDDIIVVTHPDDKKTQSLCAKYSIECVQTTAFHENGDPFNKGRAINIGLDHSKRDGWLLHADCDIVLPKNTKRLLEHADLNPKNIYGADRVNVYGWEAWQQLKPKLMPSHQSRWFVDPGFCHQEEPQHGTRFGARVVHMEHGWVPIGFFQLWHGSSPYRYNYKRGAAAGTDILFPAQWPRENRVLLPEIVCFHLDSEYTHGIGTNWKGRKSRPFGSGCYCKPPCHRSCGCHCHKKHHPCHPHKPPPPYCK